MHSFDCVRARLIGSAIMVVWLASTTLYAESPLRVIAPGNGDVVKAGGIVTISVSATPSTFQSVRVDGEGPFLASFGLSAPPYEYKYRIPEGLALGRYRFRIVGDTVSGTTVYSDPVEVDIEQTVKPTKLESEWKSATLTELEDVRLQIWGILPDGSKIDMTRSTQVTYTSDRPAIAVVSSEGTVKGVKPGKARITAKCGDKDAVAAVVVTPDPSAASRSARR